MTADGSYTYAYDAENRFTSAAGVNYSYDGDGRRVKKSSGKLYWYGFGGEVLQETNLSGALLDEYVFFLGQRVARRTSGGTVYYFFSDHLGSARIVTNATGSVAEESDFYPFGGERVLTDTLNNQYKFTGHERDLETSLDHTWYRQYASNLGRWSSADPVKGSCTDPQSLNRYPYVVNNPTNLTDPTGEQGIGRIPPFTGYCELPFPYYTPGFFPGGMPPLPGNFCSPGPNLCPFIGLCPAIPPRIFPITSLGWQLARLARLFGDPKECARRSATLEKCNTCCNVVDVAHSLICGGLAVSGVGTLLVEICIEISVEWSIHCRLECMEVHPPATTTAVGAQR